VALSSPNNNSDRVLAHLAGECRMNSINFRFERVYEIVGALAGQPVVAMAMHVGRLAFNDAIEHRVFGDIA
jgi:hypothetical protein